MSQNIQLKILRQQVILQQKKVQLTRAGRYPDIGLFSVYQNNLDDEKFSHIWKGGKESLTVGLSLTLDILDGGAKSDRIHEAISDKENATVELSKWEREYKTKTYNLCSQSQKLFENYDSQQSLIALAEKTYQFILNRFETGQASLTDLNDAELNLASYRVEALSNILALRLIETEIDAMANDKEIKQ